MLHLHTHSVYSYKKSIAKIEDICNESIRQGEKSFCITDYGSLKSFIKAFSYAAENDVKFIPGCEFLIKPNESIFSKSIDEKINFYKKEMRLKRTTNEMYAEYEKEIEKLEKINAVDNHSVILLAKNEDGFKSLVNIFNNTKEEGTEEGVPLTSKETIFKNSDGIICLSGGIKSEALYWIRNNDEKRAIECLLEWKNVFKDNFYSEIEYQEMNRNPEGLLTEIEAFNKFIEISNHMNIPLVATNDVKYVKIEDRANYRLYANIMSSSKENIKFYKDHCHMPDEVELKNRMKKVYPDKDVDKAFENIKVIENLCEDIPVQKANGLTDCSDELIKLCEEGWNKLRKGTDYDEESWKRFHYELEVINSKNFSQYFIKVLTIVKLAKELGILIGPGRGSGGGSEICYLIGITHVDPLKYGLFFERFLNPERHGFPDIDIDMATIPLKNKNIDSEIALDSDEDIVDSDEDSGEISASRNILVAELIKRGIFDFSGYISNEVNTSTITNFKALAKYYQIPFYEANKISTDPTYSEKLKMEPDKKTKKPWQYDGWLKQACEDFNLEWEDVWDQVDARMQFCYDFANIPYNASIAASGVIMAEGNPILPVVDGAIGYNGVDLESWGYIKYDLLSINTMNQIQAFKGLDFDWNETYDPAVYDTICNGELDFVFQLSGFVPKQMCMKGKPRTIDQLAEINAINRPGPLNMNLNEIWINIQNGTHKFEDENDIILSNLLKEIYGPQHSGLLVFQEEVMSLCQKAAGFTLSEADDIRKAMGKKKQELMDSFKPKFIQGWHDMGTPGDPEIIWNKMVDFAKYAFNKSHSVAYSIIGYWTAWVWTYHKDEFLEHCLNYDTKKVYQQAIDKCKELGYKFDYPSIFDMGDKTFKVRDGVVQVPIEANNSYESYVDFLFGDEETSIFNLILQGVCDKLTKDRYALAELATTLLAKPRAMAKYMEPEGKKFTKLTQILDGLKLCGAVVDWNKELNGIRVHVKRGRGNPSEVFFHNNEDDIVKANLVKYDLKMFGAIRNGTISDLPYINTVAIERTLNNIKEKYYADGKGSLAYQAMKKKLQEYMRDYFSNPFRNTFRDVYAVLEDHVAYSNSTKLILNFNDRQEILYVNGENAKKVKLMGKHALVKMTLIYSPFISRRKEEFIYDFDVESIEEIQSQ